MEPSAERPCPSCTAPTRARQRWCLECGTELRPGRRAGLRPIVGIATALAVLVGAGSAAGYTLLRDGKEPPPPATTVAQQPPPTTPPAATQEPPSYTPPPASSHTTYDASGFPTSNGGKPHRSTASSADAGGAEDGTGQGSVVSGKSNGSGTSNGSGGSGGSTTPELALTDVALGAVAVVYAPYAADDVDLGDASRVVDATTRTSWKTPVPSDPTASPQSGVYIDLASLATIRKLVIQTPTPGMSIEIYGARTGPPTSITDDGWDHLATREDLPAKATIKLPARPYRYVLVWVTGLPPDAGRAAISELSLLSLQPE